MPLLVRDNTVDARKAHDGALLDITLCSGSTLVLTARRSTGKRTSYFVLTDPWLPPSLVRQTHDMAKAMLRQSPSYCYGSSRLLRKDIEALAGKLILEAVVTAPHGKHTFAPGS